MFRNFSMPVDSYTNGPITGSDYRFFGCYRFFLATLVMISHALPLIPNSDPLMKLSLGNIGVFSFFILSGFVVSESMHKFYFGRPGRFLMNRFLRLYPTYMAALIVTAAIYYACKHTEFQLLSWKDMIGNIILVGQFLNITTFSFISVAWAVVVEMQFYIIIALVFFVLARNQSYILALAVGTLSYGLSSLGYLYVFETKSYTRFFGLLQFAPYFVLGAAIYSVLEKRIRSGLLASALVSATALLSLHAYYAYLTRNPAINAYGYVYGSLFLFIGVVLLFIQLSHTQRFRQYEKVDKYLGNLTYALFLIHPAIILLTAYAVSFRGLPAFAVVIVLSIMSAMILYHVVDLPLMALRDKIRGQPLYA